jgi:hypothetical protein
MRRTNLLNEELSHGGIEEVVSQVPLEVEQEVREPEEGARPQGVESPRSSPEEFRAQGLGPQGVGTEARRAQVELA